MSSMHCRVVGRHQRLGKIKSGRHIVFNAIHACSAPLTSSVTGTWFWEIGFVLYPPFEVMPALNPESHRDMMFVTNTFAWHVGAVALFSSVIGASVYR